MGDSRFDAAYNSVVDAPDRLQAIRGLRHAEVIHALAGASRAGDPYLANVLATEVLNRYRRLAAIFAAVTIGAGAYILGSVFLSIFFAVEESRRWSDDFELLAVAAILLASGCVAIGAFIRTRRRAKEDARA